MSPNPAVDWLSKAHEAERLRALAACLRASAAELGKTTPLAHRRGGLAYTLEDRARGIEIRTGLPRG